MTHRSRSARRHLHRLARHAIRAWCRWLVATRSYKESPRPVCDHLTRAWD